MPHETITIDTDRWAVVPRVATDRMRDAVGPEHPHARHIYRAMVAAAPRPEPVQQPPAPVVITLGKGDKLVADIYQDDEDGAIYKTGVGIFDPEPGKVYGIGVKGARVDGQPIAADQNPLVLIWSDKPESLQVIVDELQEAIARLTGSPRPVPTAIPTSERLPTEADADPWGDVAWYDDMRECWTISDWHTPPCIYDRFNSTHWQPTGLQRPAEVKP